MKFNVELTEQADKDLRSIYLYISINLNSPENAIKCKSQYKNVGLGQYKNVGFPTFLYCLFSLHLL